MTIDTRLLIHVRSRLTLINSAASGLSLLTVSLTTLIICDLLTVWGHNIHWLPTSLGQTNDLWLSHLVIAVGILRIDPYKLLIVLPVNLLLLLWVREMLSPMNMCPYLSCGCLRILQLLL